MGVQLRGLESPLCVLVNKRQGCDAGCLLHG